MAFPPSPSSPQLILLLDDYHVIQTPAIDEALAFLIDHLPPQLHLVIATRADPALPLPRLRARGQLTEIRATDLRFTAEEAAAFLNRTMDLDLTAEDVAALEARTEGWIAGLQLVALSMRGSDDASRFVADLTGSDRFILDYLAAEVLRQQPAARRAFLLQTSILDRLCGSLCDAVLDTDEPGSSQRTLEELEADNLFIVPLDNERRWYRYHRLFADFLRSRLNQVHPDQVPKLHRRAVAWYERNELAAEAIEHALQGRDLDRAARLIEGTTHALLMRGEVSTLLHWLTQLPEDVIRSRPQLSVSTAEALTVAGQLDQVEMYLNWAEEGLREYPAPTDTVQGQIYALRAYIAFFRGDVLHAARLARQAYALLPEDDAFLRSVASWFVGLTQLFGRDVATADEALTESMDLGKAAGSALTTLLSIFVRGHLEILRGHLHQAEALFHEGRRQVEPEGAPPDVALSSASPALSLVYQGLGNLHREWNDLETAERYLKRSIELAQRWGNGEVLVDTYVLLARVKRAQGDLDLAEEALREAEQVVNSGQVSPLTGRLVRAVRARFWVTAGDLDGAATWAASCRESAALPDDAQSALFLRWIEESAMVQLLLAQREFDAALDVLNRLIQRAETSEWGGILIELLALQALALQGKGEIDQALLALDQALALGEPEGYVRTFVDLGAEMGHLLRQARARDIGGEHTQQLLATIEAEQVQAPTTPPSPPAAQELIEPLTDREGEVLRLIAAGLTNQQIADELVIAHSTVKTHINNLYGKLGVSRRTQAVAALAQARAALDDCQVRAPFDGVVVDLPARSGDAVTAGQPMATLATMGQLRLRTTDLTELDVAQVTVGQPVVGAIDAAPDHPLRGHVTRIDQQGQEHLGDVTYPVFITLEDAAPEWIRWGMMAEVALGEEAALTLATQDEQNASSTTVIAEAVIEPEQWGELAFTAPGEVVEVLVAPGDPVAAGDALVILDRTHAALAVEEAQAALRAAVAELALRQSQPRPEDVTAAESDLAAAEGDLAQALALQRQLRAGGVEAEIAAVEAQRAETEAQRVQLMSQLQWAEDDGDDEGAERLREEIAVIEREIAAHQAHLAALPRASSAELRAAQAGVAAAAAQRDAVQAELDLVTAGSAPWEIAQAEAGVERAAAALAAAEVALARTVLHAAFTGTVTQVRVEPGDRVAPGHGVVVMGTLNRLQVETTDLLELDVPQVTEGQTAVVRVDALRSRSFSGQVTQVGLQSEVYRGDVTVPVVIQLEDSTGLLWGMTAVVEIAGL